MKNLLHKTLCGLLITFCFQAGAYTLHPLQLAGAIVLPGPSLAVISLQTYLQQPIRNSSVKAVAAINLSKDNKIKPVAYSECETGELEMPIVTGGLIINQRLSVIDIKKANGCFAGEGESVMIDLNFGRSTRKHSMRDDASNYAVNISNYKDRTILCAKVVC